MSPLFSEPSSGSPLHCQEKKKVKVLTLIGSAPRGLFLASRLGLSSTTLPCSSDFIHFYFVISWMCQTLLQRLRLQWHFPLLGMFIPLIPSWLTLFSLLTNHLQINVFKIVPPPGHKKIILPPFTTPYPFYPVLLFLLALFILCMVYYTL